MFSLRGPKLKIVAEQPDISYIPEYLTYNEYKCHAEGR